MRTGAGAITVGQPAGARAADHGRHTITIVLITPAGVLSALTLSCHCAHGDSANPAHRPKRSLTMADIAPIEPSRTAVLLMDFQRGTVDTLNDTAALLARIRHARQVTSAAGIQVVHVRVAFTEEQHAATPNRNKVFAALAAGGYLVEGSPEAEHHPDVRPEASDHVVTKTRVGALSTTDLDGFLRERGIDTLILAGPDIGISFIALGPSVSRRSSRSARSATSPSLACHCGLGIEAANASNARTAHTPKLQPRDQADGWAQGTFRFRSRPGRSDGAGSTPGSGPAAPRPYRRSELRRRRPTRRSAG
jgi:Isochorismatase family